MILINTPYDIILNAIRNLGYTQYQLAYLTLLSHSDLV